MTIRRWDRGKLSLISSISGFSEPLEAFAKRTPVRTAVPMQTLAIRLPTGAVRHWNLCWGFK